MVRVIAGGVGLPQASRKNRRAVRTLSLVVALTGAVLLSSSFSTMLSKLSPGTTGALGLRRTGRAGASGIAMGFPANSFLAGFAKRRAASLSAQTRRSLGFSSEGSSLTPSASNRSVAVRPQKPSRASQSLSARHSWNSGSIHSRPPLARSAKSVPGVRNAVSTLTSQSRSKVKCIGRAYPSNFLTRILTRTIRQNLRISALF
jgi:hypothetical protein